MTKKRLCHYQQRSIFRKKAAILPLFGRFYPHFANQWALRAAGPAACCHPGKEGGRVCSPDSGYSTKLAQSAYRAAHFLVSKHTHPRTAFSTWATRGPSDHTELPKMVGTIPTYSVYGTIARLLQASQEMGLLLMAREGLQRVRFAGTRPMKSYHHQACRRGHSGPPIISSGGHFFIPH